MEGRDVRRKVVAGWAAVAAVVGVVLVPPGATAGAASETVRPVRSCTELAGDYGFPGAATHVAKAEVVAADPAKGVPEYCDVAGVVAPAVKFELKLPTQTYGGRYVQFGCDGLCGLFRSPAFPAGCGGQPGKDFAVAATDDGHEGKLPPGIPPQFDFLKIMDGTWAADNQAARDDYFFRAPHVVSVAAKGIIGTFYGQRPRVSYFNGCSTGGREGLLLAQRYPRDFDGIVAGAPTNFMGPLTGIYFAWLAKTNSNPDGSGILTFTKLPALHNAVLAACDGLDGLVDGQVDDPTKCHFDPVGIQCADGVDQDGCLTPAQVGVARKLYDGPKDAQGRRLYPGWEAYGSELAWEGSSVPFHEGGGTIAPLPDNYLRYVGYPIGRPASSLAEIQFTVAELNRLTPEGRKGNALSLDLREFRRAGGKLIMWHGGYDQSIPAVGTIDYYERLAQRNGGLRKTQEFARLFVVPTKYHCDLGGELLNTFNPLPNLVSWVEHERAPEQIVATGTNPQGGPRSRPVFAYPLQARYDGSGSVDDATNFVPVRPAGGSNIIDWAGSYLYDVPGPVAR
jgi:hypothetical protein